MTVRCLWKGLTIPIIMKKMIKKYLFSLHLLCSRRPLKHCWTFERWRHWTMSNFLRSECRAKLAWAMPSDDRKGSEAELAINKLNLWTSAIEPLLNFWTPKRSRRHWTAKPLNLWTPEAFERQGGAAISWQKLFRVRATVREWTGTPVACQRKKVARWLFPDFAGFGCGW